MNRVKRQFQEILLIINKPQLALRLIKNYFRIIILRKKALRNVSLALTFDCQCKCDHCFTAKLKNKKRKEIELKDYFRIVDETIDLGTIHFTITGGEPLLNKHIFDIIDYINKKGAITSINSNGILLNEQNLKKLKSTGLDIIVVSLDALCSEKHDSFRKYDNLYNILLKNINLIIKHKFKLYVNTVVTKENLNNDELIKIIQFCRSKGLEVIPVYPVMTGAWSNKKIVLNKGDIRKIRDLFKEKNVREVEESTYTGKGCAIGSETLYITSYGDVLPCGYVQVKFGNIKKSSIKKIWGRILKIKAFNRKYKNCAASLNQDFINNILKPINKSKGVPLDHKDHPNF